MTSNGSFDSFFGGILMELMWMCPRHWKECRVYVDIHLQRYWLLSFEDITSLALVDNFDSKSSN